MRSACLVVVVAVVATLGTLCVLASAATAAHADERQQGAEALQALVTIMESQSRDNGRMRRDDGDGPSFDFLSLLDFLEPSCTADPSLYLFFGKCGTNLVNAFSGILDDLSPYLPDDCEGIACYTSLNFDQLLSNIEQSTSTLTTLYDEMCVESGLSHTCWGDLLYLLPRCIKHDVQEEFSGTYLTFDNFVNVAELLCLKNHDDASCGVLMLEFALLNQDFIDRSGHQACGTNECTETCPGLLEGIQDDLGCCYPELLDRLSHFSREFAIHDIIEISAEYWGVCGLDEPVTSCSGVQLIEDTLSPGSLGSNDDGKDEKLAKGVIVGIVAGALVVLVVVVLLTMYLTRRAIRPHQAYAFTNVEFVDDAMEEQQDRGSSEGHSMRVNEAFNPTMFSQPDASTTPHTSAHHANQFATTANAHDDDDNMLYDDEQVDYA